jgi:hypothetical protein
MLYMTETPDAVDCGASKTDLTTGGIGLDCVPKLDVPGQWKYVGDFVPGNDMKIDHLPPNVIFQGGTNVQSVVASRIPLVATAFQAESVYYFYISVVVSEKLPAGENPRESRPSYVLAAPTSLRSLPSVPMWAYDSCLWDATYSVPSLLSNNPGETRSIAYMLPANPPFSAFDIPWPVVSAYDIRSEEHNNANWVKVECHKTPIDAQILGVVKQTGGRIDIAW